MSLSALAAAALARKLVADGAAKKENFGDGHHRDRDRRDYHDDRRDRHHNDRNDDWYWSEHDSTMAFLFFVGWLFLLIVAVAVAVSCSAGIRDYVVVVLDPWVYLMIRLAVPCAPPASSIMGIRMS